MSDIAVRVENLGKRYRIGAAQERYVALRDVLSRQVRSLGRRIFRRKAEHAPRQEDFWALRDVNFEVRRGECVGIIGRNGAGKSTLLKVLSRITEPTEGGFRCRGRIASLLEVGTGFHPELTGRENIYLNGAILGMRREEIRRKFAEIVTFSEVEKFLDTPVKYYSSGMYMRLAFAVAAHLEPEILIVDEVLAVGDAAFQKKCLDKMRDVSVDGRTVLFVSHNMGAVQNLCDRAILLDRGRVVLVSDTSEALNAYLANTRHSDGRLNSSGRRSHSKQVEITDAWLTSGGTQTGVIHYGDRPALFIKLLIHEHVTFSIELVLRQKDGIAVAFAPSGFFQNWEISRGPGEVIVICNLPRADLAAGHYSIDLSCALTGLQYLDYFESGISFEVEGVAIGERNWAFSQHFGVGHAAWDVSFELAPANGCGDGH